MYGWAAAAACVALAGCGGDGNSSAGSEPELAFPDDPPPSVAPYMAMERFANADLARGEMLYLQCRACHTLEAGGAHMMGPNLHGIFGTEAASRVDFETSMRTYSEALKGSGLVWDVETMDAWLERPSELVPGNRMIYAGMSKEADRTDLIAYMLLKTSEPAETAD
jgi:cytochrome c